MVDPPGDHRSLREAQYLNIRESPAHSSLQRSRTRMIRSLRSLIGSPSSVVFAPDHYAVRPRPRRRMRKHRENETRVDRSSVLGSAPPGLLVGVDPEAHLPDELVGQQAVAGMDAPESRVAE